MCVRASVTVRWCMHCAGNRTEAFGGTNDRELQDARFLYRQRDRVAVHYQILLLIINVPELASVHHIPKERGEQRGEFVFTQVVHSTAKDYFEGHDLEIPIEDHES